jgi:L-serine dehydratase
MAISVFDMFTIGIGPSSSHTVGPMRAAHRFVQRLIEHGQLATVAGVKVELYGSLAHTGRGHGTDKAVLLGLIGETPETIDPDRIPALIAAVDQSSRLNLGGSQAVDFLPKEQLVFNKREVLPLHPNGMRFEAHDAGGGLLREAIFYSVGGGFIVGSKGDKTAITHDNTVLPYPFHSGAEMLAQCERNGMSISAIMMENEKAWRDEETIRRGLLGIWEAMRACITRGCRTEGKLPGGLKITRRAPSLYRTLKARETESASDPLVAMDWVNLYALAVNEENAAGGRVVTAPTNGAAGIVPAVLHYYRRFCPGADDDNTIRFLLTAAAIGMLYKENASISGAEVGCQGEVGVACSMAAAALTEVLGGTARQVENAAEIGMEHNLGLTCDPIGGLVQIPCIERNAMGAVKAINASRLALRGDGTHHVSLDKVIKTMRDTGRDMLSQYKETSRGGLAVNVIEC